MEQSIDRSRRSEDEYWKKKVELTWHQFYRSAVRAGLKPKEVDAYSPNEVWLTVDAWDENMQMQWEMTRAICYNVAKFGNSDPKKFPKTPQKFWPFGWDKGAVAADSKTILEQHARMVAKRKLLEEKMNKQP